MRVPSMIAAATAIACLGTTGTSQMTTSLTTAPRIGANLGVRYQSNPGDGYIMFLSAPSAGSIPVPGVGGALLLDPVTLTLLYAASVPAGGISDVSVPVPKDVSLIGATIELQPLNIGAGLVLDFGVNDVAVTFGHTGRAVIFQGTTTTATLGNLDPHLCNNNNVGTPTSQGIGAFAVQPIQHYGQEGWVEGFAPSFTGTVFYQDINTYKRNRPGRNMSVGIPLQTLVLNATRDLLIVRSNANTREFALMTIDVTTGQASILPGTVLVDNVAASATPTSMYPPQVAATDDGNLIAIQVRDENVTTTATYNRVFLVKTDGTTWPSSGNAVFNASNTAVGSVYFNNTLFFGNGRLFAGGNFGWQSCGIDGTSTLTTVALPNTGVGTPNAWIYSPTWRVSRDRMTVCLPIGGNTGSSADTHDVVSLRGISPAGFTTHNVSRFPTNTVLQRFFGNATYTFASAAASSIGKRTDLSPDGSRFAFLGGSNTAADPARLYVALTDGSQGGTLTPVTAGQFDPQVIYMCGVEFVTNNTVLFWAGTTTITPATGMAVDLYAYDVTGGTITNLTRTTTGSIVAPFTQGGTPGNVIVHSTFKSENNNWFYFVRGDNRTTTVFQKNIVGVDVNTLALRDITGSEFSGGTAPAIYRGATTRTTDPWVAVETMLKKSPVGNMAFFAAENAAGASGTLINDCNIFGFDMENGGQAVQVTNYAVAGGTAGTVNYIQSLVISPDGQHIAFANRRSTAVTASEDVFVISTSAVNSAATQMSVSPVSGGQTITDCSIQFTGAPVNAVVWSRGTAIATVPTANTVVQWRQIGSSAAPVDLSQPPVATPAKVLLVHSANGLH